MFIIQKKHTNPWTWTGTKPAHTKNSMSYPFSCTVQSLTRRIVNSIAHVSAPVALLSAMTQVFVFNQNMTSDNFISVPARKQVTSSATAYRAWWIDDRFSWSPWRSWSLYLPSYLEYYSFLFYCCIPCMWWSDSFHDVNSSALWLYQSGFF